MLEIIRHLHQLSVFFYRLFSILLPTLLVIGAIRLAFYWLRERKFLPVVIYLLFLGLSFLLPSVYPPSPETLFLGAPLDEANSFCALWLEIISLIIIAMLTLVVLGALISFIVKGPQKLGFNELFEIHDFNSIVEVILIDTPLLIGALTYAGLYPLYWFAEKLTPRHEEEIENPLKDIAPFMGNTIRIEVPSDEQIRTAVNILVLIPCGISLIAIVALVLCTLRYLAY